MGRKLVFRVAVGDPLTLQAFVHKRAKDEPGAALIRAGAVHVNGRRQRDPKTPLAVGSQVIVYTMHAAPAVPPLEPLVRYEDEDLLVLDKPAGMLAQAAPSESSAALDAWLAAHFGPSVVALHRLDRDTSGLVLAARTARARERLAPVLASHGVRRDYVAIVNNLDQIPTPIRLRITRDSRDERRRRALPEQDPSGEAATTHVARLAATAQFALVHALLQTGRTHQIRVHLAASGHPIVGDSLYGGVPAGRLMLHAARLRLSHPTTGVLVDVSSPVPEPLRALLPGWPGWEGDLTFAEDGPH